MIAPSEQFSVGSLSVVAYQTQEDMGSAAAAMAGEILRAAVARNGTGRVILATGNSQYAFVKALRHAADVPWARIVAFHMDEYIGIDSNHPASFRRWMRERVEEPLGLQMNYIDGDAEDVQAECDRYEALVREAPIDLVCMGIGENGHLAFNEPGDADFGDSRWARVISLQPQSIAQQVGEGHFPNPESVPTQAITLTIPALLSAPNVIVSAPEKRKAAAVAATLTAGISNECPATILRTSGGTLFLDSESVSAYAELRVGGTRS